MRKQITISKNNIIKETDIKIGDKFENIIFNFFGDCLLGSIRGDYLLEVLKKHHNLPNKFKIK